MIQTQETLDNTEIEDSSVLEDMKRFIEDEVKSTKVVYRSNYKRMLSDYAREKSIIKVYNGRQLLELIQNADDAGSSSILIKLDKERKSLIIANQGIPFSKEGFQSLLISDLSSKTKKKYIGNKGLGFRSVLNWSDAIEIKSSGVAVRFSKDYIKKEFEQLFTPDERVKILKNRSYSKHAVPLPVLSIPVVKNYVDQSGYSTVIEITYDETFLPDIEKQITFLQPEVLLFLNNINTINIEGIGDITTIERSKVEFEPKVFGYKEIITIGERVWKIFEKEDVLDDKFQDSDKEEKEHYNIKIALQDDLSDTINRLFTYFPTTVELRLPMVVHGTFELDDSRNQLNKSERNSFVLTKLIELIVETSKKLSDEDVNWYPLQLLNYKEKNIRLEELGFYIAIDEKLKSLALFPCVDGNYRKIKDVRFYGNPFSNFIIKNNFRNTFPQITIPIPANLYHWISNVLKISQTIHPDMFVKNIDYIGSKLTSLTQRVELIFILEQNKLFHLNEKYALLINDDKKPIEKEKSVFTPISASEDDFRIPEFINIDFLNKRLFNKLIDRYDLRSDKDRIRKLQRKLKEVVNIQPYQPASVIERIIAGTNKAIYKERKKNRFVSEMICSLFHLYKLIDTNTNPDVSKACVITKSGKVVKASEVYLSSDYPSGVFTEELFAEVLPKNSFLASRIHFNLVGEDIDHVEEFFSGFLKVNKYTKFVDVEDVYKEGYEEFVFKHIRKPINYRSSSIKVTGIGNLELADKLSREGLISWLLKDEILNKQLQYAYNTDVFKFDKVREREYYYYHTLNVKPSYIKYQLHKKNFFRDYVVENGGIEFINPFNIDYKNKTFTRYGIKEDEIKKLLIDLGAHESFSDLSLERINKIVGDLESNDKEGKNAQKIYRIAFEHYQKNKQPLSISSETKLFCKKGDFKDYFPANEVYYTDNIRLPKKIINNYPLLHFPKRMGEDNVSNFFGIKTFKNFDLQIKNKSVNYILSIELNNYIKTIKPYLLTHRLSKIAVDKTRQIGAEVSNIKQLTVEVCDQISCQVDDEIIELDNCDFINIDCTYYIKYAQDNDITSLKLDSKFCDSIAEILCIVFKVNEHRNDFRFCFKNSLEDTHHTITSDYGKEMLQEAKVLLGMSDDEKEFWKSILQLKGKEVAALNEILKTDLIEKELAISISLFVNKIDYQNLSNKANYPHLKFLFDTLKLDVVDFNGSSLNQINLVSYHREQFKNVINDLVTSFREQLWNSLKDKPENEKENFIDIIHSYTNSNLLDININDYKMSFDIDHSLIVKQQIQDKYSLDIRDEKTQEINYKAIYDKNIAALGVDSSTLSNKVKSLLCFDCGILLLKKKLRFDGAVPDNNVDEDGEVKVKGRIIKSSTKNTFDPNKTKHSGGKRVMSTFQPGENDRKDKLGKSAEEIAYNALVEKYGKENVEWVSGYAQNTPDNADGFGYDIKYRNDLGSWKYVEVKYYSSDHFVLTKRERKFAFENKYDYEVFLVRGNGDIHQLEDLFHFKEGETFFNNSKFYPETKEYVIHLKLD